MSRIFLIIWMCFYAPNIMAKELIFLGLGGMIDPYQKELLTEAFNYSASHHSVKQYEPHLPHGRGFFFMNENKGMDIVVGYSTKEREEKYLAIPIPIIKGLNGWRIPALHRDNKELFKNVTEFEQFKQFMAGVYHTWTDAKIMEHSGIKLSKGSDFDGLYQMIHAKRIDYFPRSMAEVTDEVELYSGPKYNLDIAMDPYTLLHYPTAYYFYVNKNNTVLAKEITDGLEAMIANGKFDEIFNRHYGQYVKLIKHDKRRVFHIPNPLLPSNAQLHRKELWLK